MFSQSSSACPRASTPVRDTGLAIELMPRAKPRRRPFRTAPRSAPPTHAAPRTTEGLALNCPRQSVAALTLCSSSLRFDPRRSRVRIDVHFYFVGCFIHSTFSLSVSMVRSGIG